MNFEERNRQATWKVFDSLSRLFVWLWVECVWTFILFFLANRIRTHHHHTHQLVIVIFMANGRRRVLEESRSLVTVIQTYFPVHYAACQATTHTAAVNETKALVDSTHTHTCYSYASATHTHRQWLKRRTSHRPSVNSLSCALHLFHFKWLTG